MYAIYRKHISYLFYEEVIFLYIIVDNLMQKVIKEIFFPFQMFLFDVNESLISLTYVQFVNRSWVFHSHTRHMQIEN